MTSTEETQEFKIHPTLTHEPATPYSSAVQVDVAGLSHAGMVRANNEDHFLVVRFGRFFEPLHSNLPSDELPSRFVEDGYGMVVADGVGGRVAGELASKLAITTLMNLVLTTPDWILRPDDPMLADEVMRRATERFEKVGDALTDEATVDPKLRGFGTTMTLAASVGSDLFIANIGDSRAYVLHESKLVQLTRDHTFAGAMEDAGILTSEQAATHRLRYVLTRCLGATREATPDVQKVSLANGDRLLLCSDGLNDMVSNDVIATILAKSEPSETLCNRLVDAALKAGGKDNVTVIVAQYHISDVPPSP